MANDGTAFGRLIAGSTLAPTVRGLQVPLQAELLRAGALWEESLAILREIVTHGRPFPSAEAAVTWYRAPYHPSN